MNDQDEIIEMARQAKLCDAEGRDDSSIIITDHLKAFANLVEDAAFKRWAAQTRLAVQDEREACAELCMSLHTLTNGAHNYYHFAANQIRARS